MARSIRSKRLKRLRTLKRQQYMRVEGDQKLEKLAELQRNPRTIRDAPNMFLYPRDPNAQVPQHKMSKIIDYRSDAIPNYGFSAVGVMRQSDRVSNCCGVLQRTLEEQRQIQQAQKLQQIKSVKQRNDKKEDQLNNMLENLQLDSQLHEQEEDQIIGKSLIKDVVMINEERVGKMIGKSKKIKGKRQKQKIPCKNSRIKITSFKYKS